MELGLAHENTRFVAALRSIGNCRTVVTRQLSRVFHVEQSSIRQAILPRLREMFHVKHLAFLRNSR